VKKKPTKKQIILLVILVLILIIAGVAVKNFLFPAKKQVATTIDTFALSKGVVTNSISSSGTIYSAKVENVSSSVDCPIEKIYVEVGDKVKKGDIMASLDMDTVYTNFDKAEATLNAAKRDLETKEKEYEVNKLLFNDGGVTEKELNSSLTAYENAKETYRNAETNYNTLSKDLTEGNLIAPIDGIVTEKNAEIGLKPPQGVAFVVEDTEDLYVTTKVKEFNIGSVKVGQDALVRTNVTGNKSYKGKVSWIAPKAEGASSGSSSSSSSSSTNVEFEVKVKIVERDPLMKIGMNAFVDIILESKENVFSVPFDSVVAKKGQSSIYIVDDSNKVVEIPVTTGIETATSMEIAGDGLQEGMKVILKPSLVTVGQTITPSANNLPAGTRSTNGTGTRQSGGTGQGGTGQGGNGQSGTWQGGSRPSGGTSQSGGTTPAGALTN